MNTDFSLMLIPNPINAPSQSVPDELQGCLPDYWRKRQTGFSMNGMGERKRKSVRGCIVGLVEFGHRKADRGWCKSLADPPRLVPKRTTSMLNLSKEDGVFKYVVRREEGEREVLHKGSQNRALHPSPALSSPSFR
ncbi:hypothetical protein ARMSODRAFT_1027306 [Armillaria solidipes]|uniref:Uncharacterized protein n=1 Tax=Armillaria solidipes TaxID=1076256 RepID=A0A2H3AXG4_9AGAR|nr:hypothetical protein ARMSODRAFT_1027306 [Armillaria solidipes]